MMTLVSEGTNTQDLLGQSHLLQVWCAVLSLGRWLHKEASVTPIGRHLAMKILPALRSTPGCSDKALEEVCVGALAVLLEELQYCLEKDRLPNLEFAVATYISFYGLSAAAGMPSLSPLLSTLIYLSQLALNSTCTYQRPARLSPSQTSPMSWIFARIHWPVADSRRMTLHASPISLRCSYVKLHKARTSYLYISRC